MAVLVAASAAVCMAAWPVRADDTLVIGDDDPYETVVVAAGAVEHHQGDIWIGAFGTLRVEGTLHQQGQVWVTQQGRLLVEGGELHLEGNDTNIWAWETGLVRFDGARLDYDQQYVAQHNLIGADEGRFELEDTEVDCDGSVQFIYLVEDASYRAQDVVFQNWSTWYMWDDTVLELENVPLAGDIVFYDSPTLRFRNTAFIMPWLHIPDGAVVDTSFPSPEDAWQPLTLVLEDGANGMSGIPWSISFESCYGVVWGLDPYPGSDVTVRDSQLTMLLLRYLGSGSLEVDGVLRSGSHYADEVIPVPDRSLRLVDTAVTWWKIDVAEDFFLKADDLVFSEMVAKDRGRAEISHSVCEGQTIHLGAQHSSFVRFSDGEVWSYVSVWDEAVMVLERTLVDPSLGQYIYQTRNIAHGSSRLYCLNSRLISPPEAADAAVAMVAAVNDPVIGWLTVPAGVPVTGSAWLAAGPDSPLTLDQWRLEWSDEDGATWATVAEGGAQVVDGVLGTWNTAGLNPGRYRLRLTVLATNDGGDHPTSAYPAERVVTLVDRSLRASDWAAVSHSELPPTR